MTEDQIAGLGPALTGFLNGFRGFFPRLPTFSHLRTYCRGLLSNLPPKSDIALEQVRRAVADGIESEEEDMTLAQKIGLFLFFVSTATLTYGTLGVTALKWLPPNDPGCTLNCQHIADASYIVSFFALVIVARGARRK
jgi:hypothetical protein